MQDTTICFARRLGAKDLLPRKRKIILGGLAASAALYGINRLHVENASVNRSRPMSNKQKVVAANRLTALSLPLPILGTGAAIAAKSDRKYFLPITLGTSALSTVSVAYGLGGKIKPRNEWGFRKEK
jgi:hypothetical protein